MQICTSNDKEHQCHFWEACEGDKEEEKREASKGLAI
jgi:hypothetical protein